MQCYKDSLRGTEGCDVCEESCEIIRLTLKKLSLERDGVLNLRIGLLMKPPILVTVCFHNARAMLMGSI